MADGDQRLDAVFQALVDHPVVELQARLVGPVLLPGGEDTAPGDGEPVHLEAHLGKQGDVLFIAVIVVDAAQLGDCRGWGHR